MIGKSGTDLDGRTSDQGLETWVHVGYQQVARDTGDTLGRMIDNFIEELFSLAYLTLRATAGAQQRQGVLVRQPMAGYRQPGQPGAGQQQEGIECMPG